MKLKIRSLDEYVKVICDLQSTLNPYGGFNNEILLFRGQSNENFELIPALARGKEDVVTYSLFDEERNLIEMAKMRIPSVFKKELEPVELLALLQHYGIPTRLLDVTENALVALYFACSLNETENGEVIVFKHDEQNVSNYPVINAIADSYRFAIASWHSVDCFYNDVIEQPYFLEQKRVLKNLNTDGKWIKECCENLLFIHAPFQTSRQQVQSGRYILFPNKIKEYADTGLCFEKMIEPIPKNHKDIVKIITIPKEIKNVLLKQLILMGISKGKLFCDSVDLVCEEIKDIFKEKSIYKIPVR